jgi:site-specific DNA recombinase
LGKTVIYARSSTKLQEDSVDTQQQSIYEYAMIKGLLIDDTYVDPHVSARKKSVHERPELKRLIKDIKKGEISTLIVYKRDRLARKVDEHIMLYHLFKKHKVKLHFVASNEHEMKFDVLGEVFELMIGVMNQREGEQINSRISDTQRNNFLQGKKFSFLPYGYKLNENKTKILRVESELEIVKEMFQEWIAKPSIKLKTLVAYFNKKGYTQRGGNPWSENTIKTVLQNPLYKGIHVKTFGGKIESREIHSLSIINEEEYDQAQRLLEKKPKHEPKSPLYSCLLNGMVFCKICNRVLDEKKRMKKGEIHFNYECLDHEIVYPSQELDELVVKKSKLFLSQLLQSNLTDLYKVYSENMIKKLTKLQSAIVKEKKILEEKFSKAAERYVLKQGKADESNFLKLMTEIKSLEHEMQVFEKMKIDLSNTIPDSKELVTSLEGIGWESLPLEEKKTLLGNILERILIDRHSVVISFKHPMIQSEEVMYSGTDRTS